MNRRFSGWILTGFIILFAVIIMGATQIGDTTYATAVGTVKVSGYLNVRKGPGKKYAFVKSGGTRVTLSNNSKVTIIAKNRKWYRIRFRYNSKTLKGYVYCKYLSVMSGDVCTQVNGLVSPSAVLVRTQMVKSGSVLKDENNTKVKLSKKTKVCILSESVIYGVKWYKVSFARNHKKLEGYIPAKSVVTDFTAAIPGIVTTSGQAVLKKTAGKTAPVRIAGAAIALGNGTEVLMTGEKTVSGVKYIKVDVTIDRVTYHGYITANLLRFQQVKLEAVVTPSPTPMPTPVVTPSPKPTAAATPKEDAEATPKPEKKVLSDTEFKKAMVKEGFPSSYISQLQELHKKYPKWEFKAYSTGLDWATVVGNESKVGLNLISNNKSIDWKSLSEGAYNWKTDTFIPYDGSSWVTASEKAVKYYMDPRNFLNENSIFQFESLEYQSDIQNKAGVENILKNTPMYGASYQYTDDNGTSQTKTYSQTFMEAAQFSKVSPYHLASRVKQEVVTGATTMSDSVSGTVPGHEGIYNFYNIGATHSTKAGGAIANGLTWAAKDTTYLRPWNNIYKAVVGGAQYIGSNYINIGQNTLYLQKFNVTSTNTYDHQYMANIEAPNSEGLKTASAYGTDKADMSLVFSIPVYMGMPSEACPVPSGGSNPNNYLKSLTVQGQKFTTPFRQGDDGSKVYRLTVEKSVKSINIVAKKASSLATVTGDGNKKLKKGTKTYTVKVKSQSGKVRRYKIKVTRKSS